MSSPKERIDVLVVDDEESMREFLEVVIDNEGLVSGITTGSHRSSARLKPRSHFHPSPYGELVG